MTRGVVKFFKSEKGWGAIASSDTPGGADVWVHYSAIESEPVVRFPGGERRPMVHVRAGDVVDFDFEAGRQDGFHLVATKMRVVGTGPAPLLRRHNGQVVIAPPGTPDTPLTPKRRR